MKAKTVKRIAYVLSACMVFSAVGYGVRRNSMVVQAEETLFGIETLIDTIRGSDREYTILELVPNGEAAEIGYLIGGNEPALSVRSELTGEWSSWQQELSQYTTVEERKTYIETLKGKWEAFLDIYGFTPADAPVGYSAYQESESPGEGYQQLSFAEERAKGYFEPYGSNDEWKDKRYDVGFICDGIAGDIESDETIMQYYYMQETQVTEDILAALQDDDMLYIKESDNNYVEAGTWAEISAQLSVSDGDADDNGGTVSGNNTANDAETSSETDTAAGSVSDNAVNVDSNVLPDAGDGIGALAEDNDIDIDEGTVPDLIEQYKAMLPQLPTYFLIEYLPLPLMIPGEEVQFPASVRSDTPVYIVNESSIRLNDNGKYQFVETDLEEGYEYVFSTNSVYYKGGFENGEWFRRFVLNMEEKELDTFPMKVITLTVEEYSALVEKNGTDGGGMPEYDMVYINSGLAATGAVGYGAGENDTYVDLSQNALIRLIQDISSGEKACLMDASILYENNVTTRDAIKNTRIFYLCALLSQQKPSTYFDNDGTTNIDELLAGVVEDEDKNFVTEGIYSYFQPVKLLSTDFTNPSIYHEGADIEQLQQGFSDVLDEITVNNLRREADISGDFKPLSTNISQATVIRHIINYKYRGSTEPKETIKVLEIEPCMSDYDESPDLTEEEIRSWINGGENVKSIEITRMTTAEFIGKIEDINEIYDLIYIGTDKDHMNTTDTGSTVFNDTDMDGLIYFHTGDIRYAGMELAGSLDSEWASGTKDVGGRVYAYNAVRYSGNDITEEKKKALLSFLDASYPIVVSDDFFESPVTVYQDINYGGYSCNLSVGNYDLSRLTEMGVKNDDITSIKVKEGYEAILCEHSSFGGQTFTVTDDIGNLGNHTTNGLNWNDQVTSLIVRPIESPVTVYQDINYGGYSCNLSVGNYDLSRLTEMGVKNDDITSIKVKAGYEVVLYKDINFGGETYTISGDMGYLGDDWNDQVTSLIVRPKEGAVVRKIDEDHIDNCSFMYDFVKEAMGRSNFYARDDMGNGSELFNFYLNRPKVSLENVKVVGNVKDGIYSITRNAKGRFILQYTFTIANAGAASPNTMYSCDLYIDVNADGKYSNTEAMGDISITQNGQTVAPEQLYAGREYVLTRAVPDGYKGVLPWKIQISQVNNANIHNSVTGYTKLAGLEKEMLNILQIGRDKITEAPFDSWWDGESEKLVSLEAKINDPGDIYHTLIYGGNYGGVHYDGISDDFEIAVKFMTIKEFENAFRQNKDILDSYNMLILGFSDAYGEFTQEPINAIIGFINSGKSVLFAHDTIMYWNHPRYTLGIINRQTGAATESDQYYSAVSTAKNLRGLVGLDRYGTATNPAVRQGRSFTPANAAEWSSMLGSRKEIAYKPKSNKTETVPETQGFTYSIINAKDKKDQRDVGYTNTFAADEIKGADITVYPDGFRGFKNTYLNLKYNRAVYYSDTSTDYGEIPPNYNGEVKNLLVTRVNSGQITDYPYKLADEFRVSYSHNQYYQLDFTADDDHDGQSDLVVWYCLGGRLNEAGQKQETIYSMSPNDVTNNYYIYNKGNITYTGVGHAGGREDQTVDEAKLFINTMVASYNAGIKDPIVSVLSEGHADASVVTTTYSYFDESNSISMESMEGSGTFAKVYFTVTDVNFIKGTRNIAVNCYYGTNEAGSFTLDDYPGEKDKKPEEKLRVKRLDSKIYRAGDNSEVNAGNLESAGIYYVLVDKTLIENQIAANGTSSFPLYFEAQSTIRSQGLNNTEIVQTTGKSYSKFDFTRVNLFDLE